MTRPSAAVFIGVATERRISWLTLVFGLTAGLLVTLFHDRIWGLGVAFLAVSWHGSTSGGSNAAWMPW
jgi:hypothetical protein